MLVGRREESERIRGLLQGARDGRSGVLVVKGEAGVGKTALLDSAVESAPDLRVVRAAGVESEMELPFATLHQLCISMLDRLERLPIEQHNALAVIFGLRAGAAPDRFMVGLATLSLVSDAAEDQPLLCVVDDAQWSDNASAQVLAFVARRLSAEPVAMIFSVRSSCDELGTLPQLELTGLRDRDARELLHSTITGRLDERVLDQVIAESRGIPLALLELTRQLSPAQLAGGFALPRARSLDGRLEKEFTARLDGLPLDTRRFLFVAAADPTGNPALVWGAAARLGLDPAVVEPARVAGLIQDNERIVFGHPLMRSVVYRATSPQERRNAHRALAEATDAQIDPDTRAWHLAAATSGPDETVASELERAADRAQARGGLAASAAFLERATGFTVEPSRHTHRALVAAQLKYEAGAFDEALGLIAAADRTVADDLQRARAARLRAQIVFATSGGRDAAPLLLKAARDLEAIDLTLAKATYLEALTATMLAGHLAGEVDVVEVSEAVLAMPETEGHPTTPTTSDLLLSALALRFTKGYVDGAPALRDALGALRRSAISSLDEARVLSLACWVASDLWDMETWSTLSAKQIDLVRVAGALTALPMAMSARISFLQQGPGDLNAAASMLGELGAATDATRTPMPPYGALLAAALQGRETEVNELITTVIKNAEARGEGFALSTAELASAVMLNGLGRYREALTMGSRASRSPSDVGAPNWALIEVIEAATRCQEPELARRALGQLTALTRASGTEWALGVEIRSRALLVDGEAAEDLYREAVERLDRAVARLEVARTRLLYGEWLRRVGRRSDARDQLRVAHETFTGIGAIAFIGRTERELHATGERVAKRVAKWQVTLTTQELQVARLAVDGLSNPEIGARLFISPRTVQYHLHKVFVKLDISSRTQLHLKLPHVATIDTSDS